jgi:arylsulfatase A
MVAYLDKCVGRVVEALDRLGLRERTLILFTGDNGTPRGIRSGFRGRTVAGGKGLMTDAGTHVPLLANWKGIVEAGTVTGDLVDFSDFLPTLAEAARAPLPRGVVIDGRSFLGRLRGDPGAPRRWVYVHYDRDASGDPARAVRTARWKLYGDGRLYDLDADPAEKTALAPGKEGEEARQARGRLETVLASLR